MNQFEEGLLFFVFVVRIIVVTKIQFVKKIPS